MKTADLTALTTEYPERAIGVDLSCGHRPAGAGLICTRPRPHVGPHVAHGWRGQACATWTDADPEVTICSVYEGKYSTRTRTP
jgi:hypothetical protein